jgi:hypothetical protein
MDRGAFVESLGSRFHLNRSLVLTVRTLRKSQLAVTELAVRSSAASRTSRDNE